MTQAGECKSLRWARAFVMCVGSFRGVCARVRNRDRRPQWRANWAGACARTVREAHGLALLRRGDAEAAEGERGDRDEGKSHDAGCRFRDSDQPFL